MKTVTVVERTELEQRAERLAYELLRWSEGRMSEDIVPALAGELQVVARRLGERLGVRLP